MSRIPDFTKVDLGDAARRRPRRLAGPGARRRPASTPPTLRWRTNEQIDVRAALHRRRRRRTASTSAYTAGLPPFLRGPYATMYIVRPWTVRQYAGFSTAEESNAFYRRNLAAGQKGLSVAFDLATHRGYDCDHPRVVGDVGKAGVAIDSVLDMKILFDGIPLDEMSVSMTMNGAVLPVLAFYIVAALEQGAHARPAPGDHPERHPQGVHGPQHLHLPARLLDADHRRHHRATPRSTCRSSTASRSPATTCRRPGRPPTSSWPTPWPTASSTCAPASPPGWTSTSSRRACRFFWGEGMNYFMEMAKLRAGRLLWAKLLQAVPPAAATSRSPCAPTRRPAAGRLAEQDPFNNVVRTCVEAMAAALGHTQSLHTNALDEAIALPTDFSARIARNTQLYLQDETKICNVVDPWGGSYYLEALTDALMKQGLGAHPGGGGAGRHGEGHRPAACPSCASRRRRRGGRRASTAGRRPSSA